MIKVALLLTILLGMSPLAHASQRANDPVRTLTGKALGTGGTGTITTSSEKSTRKYIPKSRRQ